MTVVELEDADLAVGLGDHERAVPMKMMSGRVVIRVPGGDDVPQFFVAELRSTEGPGDVAIAHLATVAYHRESESPIRLVSGKGEQWGDFQADSVPTVPQAQCLVPRPRKKPLISQQPYASNYFRMPFVDRYAGAAISVPQSDCCIPP